MEGVGKGLRGEVRGRKKGGEKRERSRKNTWKKSTGEGYIYRRASVKG